MNFSLRTAAWTALIYLSTATALSQIKFVTGNTALFDPIFRPKYEAHLPIIITHGITSLIVLLLGPWQFMRGIRKRFPRFHRVSGRIYLLGVLLGGITGFRMGLMAYGGLSGKLALSSLAVLWLATGAMALATILRRDVAAHRRWMIRNFTLTFAAVMLRVYLNLGQRAGLDYTLIYPVVTWLSWVPGIIAVEAWMRLSQNRRGHNMLKNFITKFRGSALTPPNDLQGSRPQ